VSAEGKEGVPKEKDKGNAVGDSVMRGEDEGAARLLMEQNSAEKRSLIGSERCVYLLCDLPLPPGIGRCNHAERDALAGDAAKVRDAVEGGIDAGREQRVTLLYGVERVEPLLDGCVAGDLGCKCMVSGKLLVEEAEELFKGAEGTEEIAGLECERLKFKGGRRHDVFLSGFEARDAASPLHGEACIDEPTSGARLCAEGLGDALLDEAEQFGFDAGLDDESDERDFFDHCSAS
jgi:hypothetical protein